MSLFECSECHVVENTACCHYHWRKSRGEPLLCSQCDPEIGEWHGRFERTLVSDTNYETAGPDDMFPGTLQPPGGWK